MNWNPVTSATYAVLLMLGTCSIVEAFELDGEREGMSFSERTGIEHASPAGVVDRDSLGTSMSRGGNYGWSDVTRDLSAGASTFDQQNPCCDAHDFGFDHNGIGSGSPGGAFGGAGSDRDHGE